MDIRIEKTRQSIINAFIELRSHKELERITIKELCEKRRSINLHFMHIIRIFIISRIHWKRKLWYQLWRISLIRREYWTILLFFPENCLWGFWQRIR